MCISSILSFSFLCLFGIKFIKCIQIWQTHQLTHVRMNRWWCAEILFNAAICHSFGSWKQIDHYYLLFVYFSLSSFFSSTQIKFLFNFHTSFGQYLLGKRQRKEEKKRTEHWYSTENDAIWFSVFHWKFVSQCVGVISGRKSI